MRVWTKIALLVVGLVILVAVLLRLNEWWGNVPPPRPADVSAAASYYGGLATPFPYPKRGQWVECWFDSNQSYDVCRVTSFDGRVDFEGTYVPYPKQPPIPENRLFIDAELMNKAQQEVEVLSSPSDFQFVPLVYLRNGSVLIPARAYKDGQKRLEELENAHSPYAASAAARQ